MVGFILSRCGLLLVCMYLRRSDFAKVEGVEAFKYCELYLCGWCVGGG